MQFAAATNATLSSPPGFTKDLLEVPLAGTPQDAHSGPARTNPSGAMFKITYSASLERHRDGAAQTKYLSAAACCQDTRNQQHR